MAYLYGHLYDSDGYCDTEDWNEKNKIKIDVATSLKIKFSQSCTPINEYAKCFFKSDFETGIGCSGGEANWAPCRGGKTGVEMKIQMNNNKTGFEMCVESHQNLKPYYGDPEDELNFKSCWIRIDGLDIFLWEDENLTNKLAIFKIDQSIEAKKESMAIVLEDKLKRYSPMQVAQKVKWATGSLVVSFKAFDDGSRKNYFHFQTDVDFYIPNDNSNDDKKPKNKKPEMEVKKSKKTNENSNDGKKPMNKNPKMEIKKTKKADDEEKSKNKKPNTEVKKRVYKRKIVDDNPDLEKKIKNKNPKMNNKKSKKADDGKKSNNKKPKPEVTKRKKANDNSKDEKKSKNKEPTKVEIKKGKIIINVP